MFKRLTHTVSLYIDRRPSTTTRNSFGLHEMPRYPLYYLNRLHQGHMRVPATPEDHRSVLCHSSEAAGAQTMRHQLKRPDKVANLHSLLPLYSRHPNSLDLATRFCHASCYGITDGSVVAHKTIGPYGGDV
jgi:hypothetical protein